MIDFDIDNNQLAGTIPTEFGNLQNIVLLDLDKNRLSGTIPTEFGRMTSARKVEMRESESYTHLLLLALGVCFSMFYEIRYLVTQSNICIVSLSSLEFHIERYKPAFGSYSD